MVFCQLLMLFLIMPFFFFFSNDLIDIAGYCWVIYIFLYAFKNYIIITLNNNL